jgi:hypothetical protein
VEEERPASRLGRNLAGILGEAMASSRAPEVAQLLGVSGPRPARIRRLVADLAVAALAELAHAEAALVGHRATDTDAFSLGAVVPEALGLDQPLGVELAGRLWAMLRGEPAGDASAAGSEPAAADDVVELGDRHLWVGRVAVGDGVVAAVLVRSQPFGVDERALLSRLMTSVAVAVSGTESPLPPGAQLRAAVSDDGRAEVVLELPGGPLRAEARAEDPLRAVAEAAAALLGGDLDVRFAGQTPIDGVLITVVLVVADRSPVLGLSITEPGTVVGPAEAVLSAARLLYGRDLDRRSSVTDDEAEPSGTSPEG